MLLVGGGQDSTRSSLGSLAQGCNIAKATVPHTAMQLGGGRTGLNQEPCAGGEWVGGLDTIMVSKYRVGRCIRIQALCWPLSPGKRNPGNTLANTGSFVTTV